MTLVQRETYCRNCEALCGLQATVEDGHLRELRPSPEHPVSRGFACAKGLAMARVQNSPSRLTRPLRRLPDGGFEPVAWEEALGAIGERLSRLVAAHGPDAVGWYLGNPAAFSHTHTLAARGFMAALGSRQMYSALSQDGGSRFVASKLLYGTSTAVPLADLDRTDFLLIIGANPFVSNGSLMIAPDVRRRLQAIVERGGRVVVVDPRRSETARAFEHLSICPGTDAWLLLAMLGVLFGEGLVDRGGGRAGEWRRGTRRRCGPSHGGAGGGGDRDSRRGDQGAGALLRGGTQRGCLRAHRHLHQRRRHRRQRADGRAQRPQRELRPPWRRPLRLDAVAVSAAGRAHRA